jgi:hypothetical protein
MVVKSLHQFFYYHSKYLNSMKCREISMNLSIGEIQCTNLDKVGTPNFALDLQLLLLLAPIIVQKS